MADTTRIGADGVVRIRDMGDGTVSLVQFGTPALGSAVVLANAVSATGAQPSQDLNGGFNLFTVVLSGSATSTQVDFEGSVDGTTWVKLVTDTAASVATARALYSSLKPVRYVRANVISVSGGSVTAKLLASN